MSVEYSTRVAALAGALTLGAVLALQAGQAERPAYLNPDLPADARAADLVSRMTLDEKISQLTNEAAAIPRLGVPGLRVVERVPARRRPRGRRDGVPAGDRARRHLRRAAAARGRRRDLRRGAREAPRVRAARPARALSGPDVLVAQHQHLPRPALGPRPGDLRRGPVPDRPHGRRVRHRPAGRRPALPEGRRDRQALRRAQRTRGRSPPLRRRTRARATSTRPTCRPSARSCRRPTSSR